jgi:transcriptional regulator with XRE-family HTH domain
MVENVAYLERAAEARRNVPEVIRILLAVTGRTSKELARALGMSSGRLSERLSGKTRISSEEVAVCALFFDVEEGLLYRDPKSFRAALTQGAPGTRAIGGYFATQSAA